MSTLPTTHGLPPIHAAELVPAPPCMSTGDHRYLIGVRDQLWFSLVANPRAHFCWLNKAFGIEEPTWAAEINKVYALLPAGISLLSPRRMTPATERAWFADRHSWRGGGIGIKQARAGADRFVLAGPAVPMVRSDEVLPIEGDPARVAAVSLLPDGRAYRIQQPSIQQAQSYLSEVLGADARVTITPGEWVPNPADDRLEWWSSQIEVHPSRLERRLSLAARFWLTLVQE